MLLPLVIWMGVPGAAGVEFGNHLGALHDHSLHVLRRFHTVDVARRRNKPQEWSGDDWIPFERKGEGCRDWSPRIYGTQSEAGKGMMNIAKLLAGSRRTQGAESLNAGGRGRVTLPLPTGYARPTRLFIQALFLQAALSISIFGSAPQ